MATVDVKGLNLVGSDGADQSRLPDNVTGMDLVKVWENKSHGESVYVLPAWYLIADRYSRRLHAIDPAVYRRLAAAAADLLARRWRRMMMLRSGGGLRPHSDHDVQSTTTTAGVQLSQLLTASEHV